MNIIKEKWLFLNATILRVPKQIRRLYAFGLSAIVDQPVVSLRANARLMALPWATAKSKAWRLTKNERFVSVFETIAPVLTPIAADDVVAVDFSDFGGNLQVLMFAKQTQNGRALPLWFDVLRYPIAKDSQNVFVIEAIKRFEALFGCKPALVFDRGFACPAIITFLKENQWQFIIRVKAGKCFADAKTGAPFAARHAARDNQNVLAYGITLRLIVSDKREGIAEPWYLITNKQETTRDDIITCYYHRFEIEEFFRDAKRLLGLEGVLWKRETSLAITLWFVILGVWCLRHIAGLFDDLAEKARKKMELSETRYAFEVLRSAIFCAAEGRYLHSYDV
ncbi:MAG: transposase [Terriglobia bacterium]